MADRKSNWQVFFGMVVVALLGWGIYRFTIWAVEVFTQLSTNVAASIVAGVATVSVSVVTVVVGRRLEANALIRKEHREKKSPVYEDLIRFMSKILMSVKTKESISEKEMVDFVREFNSRIMIWGSDEVISSWARFRSASLKANQESDSKQIVFQYEELVYAIRRDLGHFNKGLHKGTLLSLYIK